MVIPRLTYIFNTQYVTIYYYERTRRERFFFLNVHDRYFWLFEPAPADLPISLSLITTRAVILKRKPTDAHVSRSRLNLASVKSIQAAVISNIFLN